MLSLNTLNADDHIFFTPFFTVLQISQLHIIFHNRSALFTVCHGIVFKYVYKLFESWSAWWTYKRETSSSQTCKYLCPQQENFQTTICMYVILKTMFATFLACVNCSCYLKSMATRMMIIITANTCLLVFSVLKYKQTWHDS